MVLEACQNVPLPTLHNEERSAGAPSKQLPTRTQSKSDGRACSVATSKYRDAYRSRYAGFLEGSSHYYGSAIQSPYPELIFYSQTAATVSAFCMTYGLGITNLFHVSFRRTNLVSLPCNQAEIDACLFGANAV
jgi:hypothetical protein